MDYTAPHFILFEATNDPFAGIIGSIFDHAEFPFSKVGVKEGDDVKSLGVPLGKLPALQFDGVTIAGFSPVCRSIATRVGLDGISLKESGEIDMIVSLIETEMDKLKPLLEKNDVEKDKIEVEIGNFLNTMAPFLDARLQANNGAKTIVGKNTTWADFVLVYFLRTIIEVMDGYPLLENYHNLAEYFHTNLSL